MVQIDSRAAEIGPAGRKRSRDAPPLSGTTWLRSSSDPNVALASMYATGGTVGLMITAGPHWEIARPGVVLGVAVFGWVAAPTILLLRRRLAARSRHLLLAAGTVAASVAVSACGALPSSMSAAALYFLVALYAAAYFRPAAAAHVGLVGLLYAVALALHPAPTFPVQWLQMMSLIVAMALIVSSFASYARNSAASLADQAFRDPLTGLPNRAAFLNRLAQALARSDPAGSTVAVLFIDLDDFKEINDSFGHPVGDQLLISAARRLTSVTRTADMLARSGGDEFAVLIDRGAMPRIADDVAERIVAAFEVPFDVGAVRTRVGVSIGIADHNADGRGATDLMRDADLAMYRAKRRGKGRYERAQPGMQERALAHLRLVSDLQRAVENQQFEVFYQPIVAAGSGHPAGVEALVRWQHPQRGLVAPDQFISVAESSGLIVPLGMSVLTEACRQAQAWRRGPGMVDENLYVSVNLSPRQLAEAGLVDAVRDALRGSGLPSAALVLEITESTLMPDFDAGLARLQELKALGLRLALDDYGTGFSSLSRLRRLPVDILKIDKSFVDDMASHGTALVRSVIDVAHAMGMTCIAEGVETTSQAVALEHLGCDALQGYLFARPAPPIDTARALRRMTADNLDTAPPAKVDPVASVASARPVPGAPQ